MCVGEFWEMWGVWNLRSLVLSCENFRHLALREGGMKVLATLPTILKRRDTSGGEEQSEDKQG